MNLNSDNRNTIFKPRGVIFDMDGLMLDTERPMIPLWLEVGKSLGWKIDPDIAISTLGVDWDGTRKICMEELGPDFPWESFNREITRLHNAECEKGISHKKGLLFLLDHIGSKGIPMAVATSQKREMASWMLGKAGILERFSALACGDEVKSGKPAPDIFLLAAGNLKVEPSLCVGFEDSPAGLQGLHAAGIASVFIRDMILPPETVLSAVWRRYSDLSEAAEIFP